MELKRMPFMPLSSRDVKVSYHNEMATGDLPSQAMVRIIIGVADRTAAEFAPHYLFASVPVEDLLRYHVEDKELLAVTKFKRDLSMDGKACYVVDIWDQTINPQLLDRNFHDYWVKSNARYKASLNSAS